MAAALIGLMLCAYRGCSIILVAPFFAVVAALGSQHYGLPIFSELYMTKLAEYVKTYYPIFLFGAVFAKLMEKGGLASAVAAKIVSALGEERAILAVILGSGALGHPGRDPGLRRPHLRRSVRLRGGLRHVPLRGRDLPSG